MEPTFCYLGPAEPASQGAESRLQCKPSAKQAEVLDANARNLALRCNRQRGKTTTNGTIWPMSPPRRQAGLFYNAWHGNGDRWLSRDLLDALHP